MTLDENTDVKPDDSTGDTAGEAVEHTQPAEPDAVDQAAGDEQAKSARRPGAVRRVMRWVGRHLGVILVTVALVASAGLASWLYFFQYRPDQQTDAAAAQVALEAAKNGTVALLSYSPDTLDEDFAEAKSNLTGDFLSYYTDFTEQIVTPAAKEKHVETTAKVARAAMAELHPDSAVALVFINQVTTSKENPDGAFAASAVKVTMDKIDGRWLISGFDPV